MPCFECNCSLGPDAASLPVVHIGALLHETAVDRPLLLHAASGCNPEHDVAAIRVHNLDLVAAVELLGLLRDADGAVHENARPHLVVAILVGYQGSVHCECWL